MINLDNNYIIYLIAYLILPLVLLSGVKVKRKGEIISFWEKDTTQSLKGLFIIIICFHHFSIRMSNPGAMLPFLLVGFLGVAGFFAFSGYGLTKSQLSYSNYITSFLPKKILRVYVPIFISYLFIGLIGKLTSYTNNNISDIIIDSLTFTIPINQKLNWYVIAIVIFYINYYVSFNFFKGKKSLISLFVLTSLYAVVGMFLNLDVFWINTAFAFPTGVLIAYKKEDIQIFLGKKYAATLTTSIILFIVTFLLPLISSVDTLIFNTLSGLLVILILLILSIKISLDSKVLSFFGAISYELYLIHTSLFEIFFDGLNISSNLMTIITLITIVISAYCLNKVNNCILKKITHVKISVSEAKI